MSEDERTPRTVDLTSPELTRGQWLELLALGELEIVGRMPWSSNATFLVSVTLEQTEARAVYKPARGERPLWDFPGGLWRREVAAYELAVATGLEIVPETIRRDDGPLGEGSLQRFVDADFSEHYYTLFEGGGHHGALRLVAGFDLLANNADRKGGHLLVDRSEHIWGIDNGLCFHVEDKLRTVMWDYAGEEVPAEVQRGARLLLGELPASVVELLLDDEIEALLDRARSLIEEPSFPYPDGRRRSHPWPLV